MLSESYDGCYYYVVAMCPYHRGYERAEFFLYEILWNTEKVILKMHSLDIFIKIKYDLRVLLFPTIFQLSTLTPKIPLLDLQIDSVYVDINNKK